MKKLSPIFIFTILTLLLGSGCSSNKKIDDKNAISVFLKDDSVKIDPSLKDAPIKVPDQIKNTSWTANNNQEIENFYFPSSISKIKNDWENFRLFSDYRVFAPVINEGKIYHLDVKGNLYAKNLSDLKIIWKKRLTSRLSFKEFTDGKLSFYNNKIFVSGGYNFVFCVNAENGEIIWEKKLSAMAISTPIADDSQVYVITNDNKTYALSTFDGSINWAHSGILKPTGIIGSANPVLTKTSVISAYSSGEIYALNKTAGDSFWVNDLNIGKIDNSDFILNDADATPIVKDGVVYAIGNGGLMMAIKLSDGSQIWQKELASITNFWVAGDFIYLVNNDNKIICIYKKTGAVKWFAELKKYLKEKKTETKIIYNGIVMAGNNLLLTNSDQKLLVVSPLDGTILQTKKLNGKVYHSPVVVDGKAYLQTIDSYITSIVVIQ